MTEFFLLRLKTFSYLTDDNKENEKVKSTKKRIITWKLKFDYKNCLQETQPENIINQPKKQIDMDSLSENHEDIIKNNNLIL